VYIRPFHVDIHRFVPSGTSTRALVCSRGYSRLSKGLLSTASTIDSRQLTIETIAPFLSEVVGLRHADDIRGLSTYRYGLEGTRIWVSASGCRWCLQGKKSPQRMQSLISLESPDLPDKGYLVIKHHPADIPAASSLEVHKRRQSTERIAEASPCRP
jgi:hypothetical protein